jgi:hypothetical protein
MKSNLKLILTESVFTDFCVWQYLNSGLEIGGYGHVTRNDNVFTCDKIWLLTELHSPGSMHFSGEAATNFLLDRISEGVQVENLFLHWHTHPGFQPFYSPTDQNDIKEHLNLSKHLIALVLSSPRSAKASYFTRESGEEKLGISWKLGKYHQSFVEKPKHKNEIYQASRNMPSPATRYHYGYRSGSHRKLDNASPESDGFWARGELY